MAYNTPGEVLTDIADSIRTLYGSTSSIPYVEMPGLVKRAIAPIDLSGYDGKDWILPFIEHLDFTGATGFYQLFADFDADAVTPTHSLNLKYFSLPSNLTSLDAFFSRSRFTEILGIEDWDTSNITSMRHMFGGAYVSGSLDLSNWDVSNLDIGTGESYYYGAFQGATITNLKLSGWDFSSGLYPIEYFFTAANIQNLDLSNWKIPPGSLKRMFGPDSLNKNAHIGSLDLTGWDTSGITTMQNMFYGATVTKMWVPSTFVATAVTDDNNKPFKYGNLVIYTDATDAATQGWGTIGPNVVIHYNSTYQDFINA